MKIVALCLVSVGLIGSVLLQEFKPQGSPTEGVVFKFNEGFPTFSAESLRAMSFGYSRVMSGLLWMRFLQHTPPKKMGDAEVSWIYLDLDAISTLDPEFMPVFDQAAVFLSVVTDDKLGARLLLEKGVRLYPNEWRIHSYLGYHYQFELKETALAAKEYEWAAKLPGSNALMGLLAATLKAKVEGNYASIELLKSLRDNATDPIVKEKFDKKILELINNYERQP